MVFEKPLVTVIYYAGRGVNISRRQGKSLCRRPLKGTMKWYNEIFREKYGFSVFTFKKYQSLPESLSPLGPLEGGYFIQDETLLMRYGNCVHPKMHSNLQNCFSQNKSFACLSVFKILLLLQILTYMHEHFSVPPV